MRPPSWAGVPTSGRRTAATTSSRSLLPPSSPRSSERRRSEVAVPAARDGGRVVRIERLLRRAQVLGYVLEVDAHARPGGGAPAHRVDQDVGGLEVRGGLGVPRLPPLEPRQGVLLPRGAADLDQRLGRDPPAGPRLPAPSSRRLNARRLGRLLGVVGRPRRIAEAFGFLPRRELQQRLQRARMLVDLRVTVPDGGETIRNGPQGEVLRPAFVQLLPCERRRDPCVGPGAHRVGAGHRAVLGVLVVVEEDAVALLLPPLAGRQAWSPPLDL